MADGLLAGETALVTGGSAGIGRATVLALAREGARVVFADNAAESGASLAAEATAVGLDVRCVVMDLAAPDAGARLLADALGTLGRLSILVHSASPPRREVDHVFTVDDATWDRMIAVNVTTGFRLARAAATHMIHAGIAGKILFLTSLHAEFPRTLPHYSASKAGMTMLMKELAYALARHNIRVNAIAPGAIGGGTGFKADPALVERIPMGRIGGGDDIADMAVALLCDRFSRYVTGTTVRVDGGLGLTSWFPPPTRA